MTPDPVCVTLAAACIALPDSPSRAISPHPCKQRGLNSNPCALSSADMQPFISRHGLTRSSLERVREPRRLREGAPALAPAEPAAATAARQLPAPWPQGCTPSGRSRPTGSAPRRWRSACRATSRRPRGRVRRGSRTRMACSWWRAGRSGAASARRGRPSITRSGSWTRAGRGSSRSAARRRARARLKGDNLDRFLKGRGKAPGQYLGNGLWANLADWPNYPDDEAAVERVSRMARRRHRPARLPRRARRHLHRRRHPRPGRRGRGEADHQEADRARRPCAYRAGAEGGLPRPHQRRRSASTKTAEVLIDGEKCAVELIGAGAQGVIAGIHPFTEAPYDWPLGGLDDIGARRPSARPAARPLRPAWTSWGACSCRGERIGERRGRRGEDDGAGTARSASCGRATRCWPWPRRWPSATPTGPTRLGGVGLRPARRVRRRRQGALDAFSGSRGSARAPRRPRTYGATPARPRSGGSSAPARARSSGRRRPKGGRHRRTAHGPSRAAGRRRKVPRGPGRVGSPGNSPAGATIAG